jgi:phytoene dehydrogenase-like protein
VLERRELVGGCAVTEEVWPGYRVSTGAYLTSLLQERIVRELQLERYGYKVDAKDPAFFSVFPDGRHFFMWQDRAKTLEEISRFSRRDAAVYPAYEDQSSASRKWWRACCSPRLRSSRRAASGISSTT